jgi:protein-L-isoaspartate(D-aspartate) O-methyltransferase
LTPAWLSLALLAAAVGCSVDMPVPGPSDSEGDDFLIPVEPDKGSGLSVPAVAEEDSFFTEARQQMVDEDLAGTGRDITDRRVLEAMGRVPRHLFVPDDLRHVAYADRPLPIGHSQTISQPYIVALMTQLVEPTPESKALDIGTGSGYQAAVLAELCKEVYSIEIVEPLADEATKRLADLGYKNITVRHGDGYRGWKEHAPFDLIVVAAAPDHVPQPLVDQLAPGGKLVIPVGDWYQELILIERSEDDTVSRKSVIPVAFVPMTGEARER